MENGCISPRQMRVISLSTVYSVYSKQWSEVFHEGPYITSVPGDMTVQYFYFIACQKLEATATTFDETGGENMEYDVILGLYRGKLTLEIGGSVKILSRVQVFVLVCVVS